MNDTKNESTTWFRELPCYIQSPMMHRKIQQEDLLKTIRENLIQYDISSSDIVEAFWQRNDSIKYSAIRCEVEAFLGLREHSQLVNC